MKYKTYLIIAYAFIIGCFIAGLAYHIGSVSKPHYKPIYVKYNNVSHSLFKSIKDSGIEITYDQWDTLQQNLTKEKASKK